MSNEVEFAKGLIVKPPHDRAPEYVKARLSIKIDELLAWLNEREGEWVNIDIKESQNGKWYAAVDNWKPETNRGGGSGGSRGGAPQRQRSTQQTSMSVPPADDFGDDDIPFVTNRGLW